MAKKRKAGGKPFGEREPKEVNDEDAKMRVTTFEDVADSEDEFHMNRDQVLLEEGPAQKKLRQWQEQEEFLQDDDEEVLDYDDLSLSEDDDEEEEEEAEDVGLSGSKKTKDAEEEEEGWGPARKDYYNADQIETEQDALDEEAEARRLQQKQLAAMTEADFGFDEEEWLAPKDVVEGSSGKVVTEKLPQLLVTDDMTEKEKLKILHSRYPEFEPIRQEYLRLQPLHVELKAAADAAERLIKSRAARSGRTAGALRAKPNAVLKYWACASYLGAMCMYFAVLTSTANEDGSAAVAIDPVELHEHPVMESLLKCQRVWQRVERLPVADPMVETSNIDELSVIEEASPEFDAQAKLDADIKQKRKEKKAKKSSKAQLAAEAAQDVSEARRAEKLRQTEEELANLADLTDKRALKSALKKKLAAQPTLNLLNADDSDFGEETVLTAHELAEKAKKKKSLRFHTSQIVQKVHKRGAAGKDQGGDTDIPHRERLRDRQARLQEEAEKRGASKKMAPGAALGDDDGYSSNDEAKPRTKGAEGEDYYETVVAANQAKKEAKAEKAAAYAQAAKENAIVVPEEIVGPDGKRKITYLIQKNKGLTPFRKKEVRNPRVKKKLKYESKMKKLKSMKPVYGGGEGKGGYSGEMTGIKTGLVRSVKL